MASRRTKRPRPKRKLRFAGFIRVSSEKQAEKGESLRTQRAKIEQSVALLDGDDDIRWYGGQEHGTPDWEKAELERMLSDAEKSRKPFDAVMVTEPLRWSRDNDASESGLKRLRKSDTKFFIGTTEQKLHDPTNVLCLRMYAIVGEWAAKLATQSSIDNSIRLAERGVPVSGRLPFGRTYDFKNNRWGVDETKKAIVQEAATRYLAGEAMRNLAKEFKISNLHEVLTQKCGSTHTIVWKNPNPESDAEKVVTMAMPELLDAKTIKAIHEKAEANKTYMHGQFGRNGEPDPFVLRGRIFCAKCGYALRPQTQGRAKKRYYRHSNEKERMKECPIEKGEWPYPPADMIEEAVLRELFQTFGNPHGVRKAIDDAIPNKKQMAEYVKRRDRIEADLEAVNKARNRILSLIDKDAISDEQAEQKLHELNDREAALIKRNEQVAAAMTGLPSKADVDRVVEKVGGHKVFFSVSKGRYANAKLIARQINLNERYDRMTLEDKRALVELIFNGKRRDGSLNGVYVEVIAGQIAHRPKDFAFTLCGLSPIDQSQCVTQSEYARPSAQRF